MKALLAAAALAAAATAPAPPSPSAGWTPAPRKIAALYDPRLIPGKEKDIFFLDLHQHVELPLNHLGFVVEYLDVSRPLPEPASLKGFAGAVAWFPAQASFDDPRPACRWLSGAMAAGIRVALVGNIGVYEKRGRPGRLSAECADAMKSLGVQATGVRQVDPLTTVVSSASAMMGFERKPDLGDDNIVPLVRLLPGGRTHLRVDLGEGMPPIDPVGVTPKGAVALDPFFFYSNVQLVPSRKAWVVDPFAFFEAAFGARGLPRPDPYTLSGRRMFMTRLDGDGFFNLSESDRRKTAGAVFISEILETMKDTPFTISLISGYYDLALYSDPGNLHLSRLALSRQNVEPASHTHAHPLIWSTLKSSLAIPRYAPNVAQETGGSARMLERLFLPRGKRVGLVLWSGDCRPTEQALEAAENAGLLHMNGGGGRFDRSHPSLAHLFPIGRQVGARRQIYAPSHNENDYTDLWSARYYGYRDVIETFQRSGSPRRLKPVDVYVHFYSAERFAALQSLKQVYAWARAQPLIPVFSGRFARAARDFSSVSVERQGDSRFRLTGGPDMRTVRLDDSKAFPDLRRSKGVIGWKREDGALYVALDRSESRELVLSEKETPGPRLEEADFEVEAWTPSGDGVAFEKSGWWDGFCVLAGLRSGGTYRVRAGAMDAKLKADARGRLEISFGGSERGGAPTRVTVGPA